MKVGGQREQAVTGERETLRKLLRGVVIDPQQEGSACRHSSVKDLFLVEMLLF